MTTVTLEAIKAQCGNVEQLELVYTLPGAMATEVAHIDCQNNELTIVGEARYASIKDWFTATVVRRLRSCRKSKSCYAQL